MTRVALAHDYLLIMRGAERTFAAMSEVWPDAPIHTLLYDEWGTEGRFAHRDVHTSVAQRLGVNQHSFRKLLPLYPTAVATIRPGDHDLLVSSSSAFAHGVRAAPGARHICYCHSPFRYAWHDRALAMSEVPRPLRPVLALALARHRRFDRRAAGRLTGVIANSLVTRERLRRFWGIENAPIVHPPVEMARFSPSEGGEDLLFVGEVTRHKRVEVALEAAERAGRRIRIVGEGPDLPRLRRRFDRALFLGRVDDAELQRLYATSSAVVVPGVEEFGIAAVEAQASGRPVIAADAGGARETVRPEETGWLVPPDDVDAMAATFGRDVTGFDPKVIRANAERFSTRAFQHRLLEAVHALA